MKHETFSEFSSGSPL